MIHIVETTFLVDKTENYSVQNFVVKSRAAALECSFNRIFYRLSHRSRCLMKNNFALLKNNTK